MNRGLYGGRTTEGTVRTSWSLDRQVLSDLHNAESRHLSRGRVADSPSTINRRVFKSLEHDAVQQKLGSSVTGRATLTMRVGTRLRLWPMAQYLLTEAGSWPGTDHPFSFSLAGLRFRTLLTLRLDCTTHLGSMECMCTSPCQPFISDLGRSAASPNLC